MRCKFREDFFKASFFTILKKKKVFKTSSKKYMQIVKRKSNNPLSHSASPEATTFNCFCVMLTSLSPLNLLMTVSWFISLRHYLLTSHHTKWEFSSLIPLSSLSSKVVVSPSTGHKTYISSIFHSINHSITWLPTFKMRMLVAHSSHHLSRGKFCFCLFCFLNVRDSWIGLNGKESMKVNNWR